MCLLSINLPNLVVQIEISLMQWILVNGHSEEVISSFDAQCICIRNRFFPAPNAKFSLPWEGTLTDLPPLGRFAPSQFSSQDTFGDIEIYKFPEALAR